MRWPSLSSLLYRIGIDLGSQTTRIWTNKDGVILEEPTCVAIEEKTKRVIAVGQEAAAMSGRVGQAITVVWPVHNGLVHDTDVTRALLRVLLQRVFPLPYFLRPTMMVSVPASATETDRHIIVELLYSLGAREVYSIAQSLAAAIGAGIPIADASGSFIMQNGAGISEASVISLGTIVATNQVLEAGATIDTEIQQAIEVQTGLHISLQMAAHIKATVAHFDVRAQRQLLVSGQDVESSAPKEVIVTTQDVIAPVQAVGERTVQLLKQLLSRIPPELTVDVIDKGMLLSGGGSQLAGLDAYLVEQIGVPVSVVDAPERAVIKGIGQALENIDLFRDSLVYRT